MPGDLLHVVLLKFRADADPAVVQKLGSDILALRGLPSAIELEFGPAATDLYPGYNDRRNGFTHCLFLRVKDGEQLEHYAKSPEHVAVVNVLKTVLDKDGLIAIDFFPQAAAGSANKCKTGCCSWFRSVPTGCAVFAGFALGVALALYLKH
eukprot:m.233076 g.233076  ORF g.233076 m.233076 type:complete len:151 (+) comp12455_c0_seq1:1472-1924(+)